MHGGRPEVQGREAIRDFFASFPVQAAWRFVHNHVVHTDGRTSHGYSYLDGREVPTMAEAGFGAVEGLSWDGVPLPRGRPRPSSSASPTNWAR